MILLPLSKKQHGSSAHSSAHKHTAHKHAAHAHAPKQERRLAKAYGGRVTAASGALDEKGDVRLRGIARIEAKCTSNKRFSIDRTMLQKIESASVGHSEIPVVQIDFLGAKGQVVDSCAVIPMRYLEMIFEKKIEKIA